MTNVRTQRLPVVYFAGSISAKDWRHGDLCCPSLRGWVGDGDPNAQPGVNMPLPGALGGRSLYGGPFFRSCDHGCFHGESSHGVGAREDTTGGHGFHSEQLIEGAYEPTCREEVVKLCCGWIRRSDAVFVWLDADDAYGTVTEIGYAAAFGIPIYLYEPPEGDPRVTLRQETDMWFMRELAGGSTPVSSPEEALARFTHALPYVRSRLRQ